SLADDQAEFHSLADKLWGSGSSASVGKGRVYGVQKVGDVLQTLHISPDFEYTKPKTDATILFVHRKLADGDLYFLDNRNDRDEGFDAIFRIEDKAAELNIADRAGLVPIDQWPNDCAVTSGTVGHGIRRFPTSRESSFSGHSRRL